VTLDESLHRFRLRAFGLARELGSVRAACRALGIHPSTYYRWRPAVLRSGLEMLRPRERRPPRTPNQLSQLTEQRILAFSLERTSALYAGKDVAVADGTADGRGEQTGRTADRQQSWKYVGRF
jgi:hypothetical protein